MVSTVAVGTDGSDTAQRAVEAALDLAERFGAKLVILSAYTSPRRAAAATQLRSASADELAWGSSAATQVERILAAAEESAARRGVESTSDMSEGDPGEVLVELADRHDADVLVVGSKGMHRRVLGSVPNTVAHKATCAVFLVKTV